MTISQHADIGMHIMAHAPCAAYQTEQGTHLASACTRERRAW